MKAPTLKTSRYLAVGEVVRGLLTNEKDGYHFEEIEDWTQHRHSGRCQLKSFGRVRLARLQDGRLRLTATWDAEELTAAGFSETLQESENLNDAFIYITKYAERRSKARKRN